MENFREQRSVWKGSPVFLVGIFQTEIRVPFLKSHLWYQLQAFTSVFRLMELICEFCLPFTQTVNRPVYPCKSVVNNQCLLHKFHSPSISIRLAFFWFRMTNNSRWSDFRPTIQQSDMVFTNVSPSSWKLQRRNKKKASFIALTIDKEGKSGAVYVKDMFTL